MGNASFANILMFVPASVGNQVSTVTRLMSAIRVNENATSPECETTEDNCYLILMRKEIDEEIESVWQGEVKEVVVEAEMTVAVGDIQVWCENK